MEVSEVRKKKAAYIAGEWQSKKITEKKTGESYFLSFTIKNFPIHDNEIEIEAEKIFDDNVKQKVKLDFLWVKEFLSVFIPDLGDLLVQCHDSVMKLYKTNVYGIEQEPSKLIVEIVKK